MTKEMDNPITTRKKGPYFVTAASKLAASGRPYKPFVAKKKPETLRSKASGVR